MTWKFESFKEIGGTKDHAFLSVMGMPSALRDLPLPPIELAVSGPMKLLRGRGWRCVQAFPVSSDVWRYYNYIASSMGEFSVAKSTYVSTHSGWFSDRTECYLAAGRPAVVQETGFSEFLPTGDGLVAWNSPAQAIAALEDIMARYDHHARHAREIAVEHFRDVTVLSALLDAL